MSRPLWEFLRRAILAGGHEMTISDYEVEMLEKLAEAFAKANVTAFDVYKHYTGKELDVSED